VVSEQVPMECVYQSIYIDMFVQRVPDYQAGDFLYTCHNPGHISKTRNPSVATCLINIPER
jgi:hypothetical protein